MKRCLLLILSVVSCLAVAACHASGTPGLKKAVKNPELAAKALTLAPVFKDFIVCYDKKDYKGAYKLLSTGSRKELAYRRQDAIGKQKATVRDYKRSLLDTHHGVSKVFLKREIRRAVRRLKMLKSFQDHPEKYLEYVDHPLRNPSNLAKDFAAGTMKIAGEKINGEYGMIMFSGEKGSPAGSLLFVREDDKWKVDFFRTSESVAPMETPPSAPEPQGPGKP